MTNSQASAISRGESARFAPRATKSATSGLAEVADHEVDAVTQEVARERRPEVAEPDEADLEIPAGPRDASGNSAGISVQDGSIARGENSGWRQQGRQRQVIGTGSPVQRWYVLIMMVLVYTLSIADRYVISTVLEPIRLELQLTDSGIAFLTGVALALFYVVLGFPISWLIDRGNRRNIIAVCLVLWSAMTAFCGLSKNYVQLLIGRIGVGVGEAGGTPGASSIISDYFPAARRPMALTVFSLGAPIGAWLGADIAGIINDAYDWRTVFLVLGVPGVVVGLLIFLTVREPRRGQLDHKGGDHKGASFAESMRFLWTQKSAVHVMVGSAVTALWGWGLMWWTPTFLIRNYAMTPGEAGAIVGPIHLVGGGLATLLTGWWMAQPSMRDPRRIVRMMGTFIGWWPRSSRSSSTGRTTSGSRAGSSGSSSRPSTSTSAPASACSRTCASRACARSSARRRCSSPTSAT